MECTHCRKPTNAGITLCHDCTTTLEYNLAEVDNVWDELQVTVARLDVGARTVTRGPTGSRPPINLDAMDKGQTLWAVLTGWGCLIPAMNPTGDPKMVSSQFMHHIPEVRKQDWAGDLYQELSDALNECRWAVDRAEQRIPVGTCPEDGTPIYTKAGQTIARCKTCTGEWDTRELRDSSLERANIIHGTPVELSRILADPVTGDAIPLRKITDWIYDGRLPPVGTKGGRNVYELSTLRSLWEKYCEKRPRRRVSC